MKALFFDLDGTLTDSRPGIFRCIQYALEKLQVPSPPESDLQTCLGPPLQESFARLLNTADSEKIDEAVQLYRDRFEVKGIFENAVYPGIEPALTSLSKRYQLFVTTSKPEKYAVQIIAHFSLDRFFQKVYGSFPDGRLAQKADLIKHVLTSENLPAAEVIMIGDRHHDVNGARANGVVSVGAAYGYGSVEELSAAGANKISHSPRQLVNIINQFTEE